jgi:hypothetical protein
VPTTSSCDGCEESARCAVGDNLQIDRTQGGKRWWFKPLAAFVSFGIRSYRRIHIENQSAAK